MKIRCSARPDDDLPLCGTTDGCERPAEFFSIPSPGWQTRACPPALTLCAVVVTCLVHLAAWCIASSCVLKVSCQSQDQNACGSAHWRPAHLSQLTWVQTTHRPWQRIPPKKGVWSFRPERSEPGGIWISDGGTTATNVVSNQHTVRAYIANTGTVHRINV